MPAVGNKGKKWEEAYESLLEWWKCMGERKREGERAEEGEGEEGRERGKDTCIHPGRQENKFYLRNNMGLGKLSSCPEKSSREI